MTNRESIVAYARSLAGISADPAAPTIRARYIDTIAPGETPKRAAEMALMSGCALTCRAILRRFIQPPILEAPYRDRMAVSDLVQITRQANAFRLSIPTTSPCIPGDMLIVGGGEDGGGAEHAWTALSCVANPYPDGGYLLDGLDGGQRDAGGHQCIVERDHEIRDGWDITSTYRRRVRYVIDVMAIVQRFGR